eukprot:gene22324-biopygen17720
MWVKEVGDRKRALCPSGGSLHAGKARAGRAPRRPRAHHFPFLPPASFSRRDLRGAGPSNHRREWSFAGPAQSLFVCWARRTTSLEMPASNPGPVARYI